MRTYNGSITALNANQIFVFGSNTQGRHGKGAALWALKNANAVYGKSYGLQGQSYAIITKDLTQRIHPSVSIEKIKSQIRVLYSIAIANPVIEYLIAYSTKPNLNGYTPQDMAYMFGSCGTIPDNIVFEHGFAKLIAQYQLSLVNK